MRAETAKASDRHRAADEGAKTMTILDPGARPGHAGHDAAKPSPRAGTGSPLLALGYVTRPSAEGHHLYSAPSDHSPIKSPKDKSRIPTPYASDCRIAL